MRAVVYEEINGEIYLKYNNQPFLKSIKQRLKEKEKLRHKIANEAVRIANDYPELTAKQALDKAKEIYNYDED